MSESLPSPSIVIFGASGDLTWRKLIPALYNLRRKKRLTGDFRIIGYARSDFDNESFRERLRDGLETFTQFDSELWDSFSPRLHYVQGDYDDPADLQRLDEQLKEMEPDGAGRLYYLSVPPGLYASIAACLGQAEMVDDNNGWRRLIIEKPFGHDLQSAHQLNQDLHEVLDERQIYRIDHYLGKETVQNMLVFRFANTIFEPVWNRNYIHHVEITAAEAVDVAHRAGYYDEVGVLRDMFQNHLMQLLCYVAMEPPTSFAANALRNEKVKVLSAIRPMTEAQVSRQSVRGQYEGYRNEQGVPDDSETETFGAVKLFVDNWRWQGVPFYLRSGKALARKTTELVILFKQPPHIMFENNRDPTMDCNYISLCIQPDEGIHLRFEAKIPDTASETRSVDMEFHYDESFGENSLPKAYERLLLDALNGDAALFTRADEIELAWRLIDSIIAGWQSEQAPPLHRYEAGSWGPAASVDLIGNGDGWIQGCAHDD